MDGFVGLLPLLVLAACPLMMAVCFFGMRKAGHSTESALVTRQLATSTQVLEPAGQIAALRTQLDRLQHEQAVIARQIDALAAQERDSTAPIDGEAVAMTAATPVELTVSDATSPRMSRLSC